MKSHFYSLFPIISKIKKLKILLIHYRYHSLSGPERYLFNLKALLESKGHTVIPFSINYVQNEKTEYDKYFVEPLGDKSVFNYNKQKDIGIVDKYLIAKNFIYNQDVYQQLSKLIRNEKPEIAYILQYFGKLTHAVFDSCKDHNIPTVLRLSDYGLICAKNIFFRNGQICTECIDCQWNGVKHKCIHNSYSKSILNFFALKYAYYKGLTLKIDSIVTPSIFMKNLISKTRYFGNNNIVHIPTFFLSEDRTNRKKLKLELENDFSYIGRIDEDKGLTILIQAVKQLRRMGHTPLLSIAGNINNEYARKLIDECINDNLENVSFVGLLDKNSIFKFVSNSKFSIVPSIWYDNMPNSLIESQSCGTPIIASNIGSLSELVIDGYNGYLFNPGDSNDLCNIMIKAMNLNDSQLMILKSNSLDWVSSYCSEEKHYSSLMTLFNNLITEK